jgi:EAL domain-containing protein (putative c-di-GMP-specific phosphodiesterase class I)
VVTKKGASWPTRLGEVSAVTALMIAAAVIVYASGGTRFAYVHASYIPIIAAAAWFGLPGGLCAAALMGLAMGPLMPLDVDAGTYQSTTNWLMRAGFFILIGGLSGFAFAMRTRQLQIIRRHGYYSPLTGLPNRTRCLRILDHLLRTGSDRDKPLLLLSLGIGRFEALASSFGHEHADALQKEAAQRLQDLLPKDTKLFHISSGIFALILIASPEEAESLGDRLVSALDEQFVIGGVPILPGGHGGIAQYGLHAADALSLLRASTAALRNAETERTPLSLFDHAHDVKRQATLRLMPALQNAIRGQNELTLHYQPKVDMKTGICTGAEALVRWTHPEQGKISPAEFIPLAEQTTLIKPLTERVLGIAVTQLSDWEREGFGLTLAVNVSIRNLEDSALPAEIAELLRRHGVAGSRLELEVTESALMASPETVIANLLALRELGVSIALDDFGTGQSSLSYLRDLPATTIKLDRSFIQDLVTDQKSRLIIGSTIRTAHKLGFKVVAEGIEERADYDLLRRLSCDTGQGYFFAPALPKLDFEKWVEAKRSGPGQNFCPVEHQ